MDDDFQRMAQGPLGVFADGPDGRLFGFLDRATEENWRITEFGRHETRLDNHCLFRIGAAYRLTLGVQGTLVFPDQPNHRGPHTYRVQDIQHAGDLVVETLYLVLVA